jgi:hypothetical protein
MDFGTAFGFVFEDEEWIKKVLLGALILLIPIVGQLVVFGYGIAVIRNVKAGNPRPLPSWNEFAEHLSDGFKYWVATMIYAIPILLLLCPLALISLLPALSGGNEDALAILSGVAGLAGIALLCIVTVYGMFLALVSPVLQIRFAETGELSQCLRFGDVSRYLFRNVGSIVVAVLLSAAVGGVLTTVLGTVSLGILALPASVWVTMFASHLYGQIARGAEADDEADNPAGTEELPNS